MPLERDSSMKLFCPVLSTNVLYKNSWGHRVDTEWQLPLSAVHSIMMKTLAQTGEWGRVERPSPFHSIYHHVQSFGVH
jgi:hypothetical protein